VDGRTLLLILAGFAVVVVALVLAASLGHRFGGDFDLVRVRRTRSWWGRPGLWVLVSATSVLLGVFVFPKLFGFTFIFLPFLWPFLGGLRRGRHGPREDREGRSETGDAA
jgi:hypothetical protein